MTAEEDAVGALIRAERLPEAFHRTVDLACRPIADRVASLRAARGRPVVLGLCGSQGSGKSTVAAFVALLLKSAGLSAAVLSLDDLYLTRQDREALAKTVHPLLRTRGVPGTHDPRLGIELIDALTRPSPDGPDARRAVRLPRFDKAADTRAPPDAWPKVEAPVDVVLFEGWCVGARPQDAAELDAPVNALERERDPEGGWRRYVNARLAGDYRRLFDRIDFLALLQAPGFERVFAWRALQERKLAERLAREGGPGPRLMDEAELAAFVMHYERLTRHILAEMPARADAVVRLGPDHEVEAVAFARPAPG